MSLKVKGGSADSGERWLTLIPRSSYTDALGWYSAGNSKPPGNETQSTVSPASPSLTSGTKMFLDL